MRSGAVLFAISLFAVYSLPAARSADPALPEFRMRSARRHLLRSATADAHQALDSVVGRLDSIPAYRRYVSAIFAFRQAAENGFTTVQWPDAFEGWRPQALTPLIQRGLDAIGATPIKAADADMSFDISGLLGTLYVLEGSALGARLLYRDVLKLGFADDHGASHLAAQANSNSWPSFLAVLDRAPDQLTSGMVEAAGRAFQAARKCFHQAIDERS